ncbi:hypothetical protein [Nocardioides insulae]|uniref:hypothetical protein n=1 Tax=Nocardioides insulae TaxID=394734 RepID=UPI00041D8B51|nr:hypothetical protein [Nocardioides insulae]
MAAASDPAARLVVGSDSELAAHAVRSHLDDGRVVAWIGPEARGEIAIDAERERPVPPALGARLGRDQFWQRWTRLEVIAKLTDVPVIGLLPPASTTTPVGMVLESVILEASGSRVVVSLGRRR